MEALDSNYQNACNKSAVGMGGGESLQGVFSQEVIVTKVTKIENASAHQNS